MIQDKDLKNSLTRTISDFINAYQLSIISLLVCAVILGAWGPINAFLISTIINEFVINSKSTMIEHMFWPSLFLGLSFLIYGLALQVCDVINNKIQPEIKSRVDLFTYKYILQHSPQFYQSNNLNKIIHNINALAVGAQKVANQVLMRLCKSVIMLVVSLSAMYFVNSLFFVGLCICVLLYGIITYRYYKKIGPLTINYTQIEENLSAAMLDGINNAQNIKIYNNNNEELDYLAQRLKETQKSFKNKSAFIIRNNFFKKVCLALSVGCAIYALIYVGCIGKLSISELSLLSGLSVNAIIAICTLTEHAERLSDTIYECKKCINNLFLPLDVQDKPAATKLNIFAGRIQFNNVNYRDSVSRFKNLTLTIQAGQKIGIVGLNANDKAAFVNLILRMVNVSFGSIKIDNQNICDVTQSSLHRAIGYVSQDTTIFNRSIMDNIRYGNRGASDFEVISAAKHALAHQFIQDLPLKYETVVGEHGIKLTASQCQRIAIARALLKDSPILILDEPILQADSIIEQREMEDSLWHFMRNKTVLLISNRISTMQLMDRVLVFENGKIIEDSTHEQLLFKSDNLYNTLWNDNRFAFFANL